MSHKDVYDVTIIGAGPAGLFSAFYAGLREMKTKIIEFHPFLGGKVNVYPEKVVWDIGGLIPCTGEKLIEQLIQQGTTFDPTIVLNEKVCSIEKVEDLFLLHTHSGQIHYSKTIILAVGGGILRPTKLTLEGAEKYEVTNLHYTVKSLARFKDKTVLISGGGNTALDWASELSEVAKKVYLTYRKEELKGHEATITKMQKNGVQCLLNTEIEKLIASSGHDVVEKVILKNNEEDEAYELTLDEIIICHGFDYETELVKNSKVELKMRDQYSLEGNVHSETTVAGIFAAGDVLGYDGKLHLIAGAFNDAANAVNRAKQYIAPTATPYGMVSSHNDIFSEKNKELKKLMFS